MSYLGMTTRMVAFAAHGGATGEAYYAAPSAAGKMGGVVLVHHMPGWDDWTQEAARKLAHFGFACIAPHLYFREGPGSPDDLAARARTKGGVADDQVMGDVKGCMAFLRAQPESNGKVAVMGFCSGGATPISPAARCRGSTRWWIAGAAMSSWTIPPISRLRAPWRRST